LSNNGKFIEKIDWHLGVFEMRKSGFLFTIIYMLIFYLWIYVYHDNEPLRIFGAAFFPIVGAVISFVWLFRTFLHFPGKQRYSWLMLSMAALFFIVAQIVWGYQLYMYQTPPFPGWADVFWISQYLFNLAAVIYKITVVRNIPIVHFLFHIAIFMTIAITLSVHFLINPILESSFDSIWGVIVSLAYPIIDLALLFVTISLYYIAQYSIYKKRVSLITLGFIIQILADSIHTCLSSTDSYLPGGFLDPLWVFPLLFIGLAGINAMCSPVELNALSKDTCSVKRGYNLIPYAGVFFLLLYVIFYSRNKSIDSLDIGLTLVMLLVIIRQIIILLANRKLLQELTDKNEELGKSEERYRQLVEISPNATFVDIKGRLVYINRAGLELLGAATPEEALGKSVADFIDGNYLQTIHLRRQRAVNQRTAIEQFEFPIIRLDGQIIYVESTLAGIDYNGKNAFLSVVQDVTHRKKIEERIKYMAYFDKLTALPNRAMFHEQLMEQIEKAKSNHCSVGVMFIDLDRFKFINDSMGHFFGDLFLKKVAQRINRILDHQGTVYRLGGDEFCVLIKNADEEKATVLAQQIIEGFTNPFILENREFFTSPSIGISFYPKDGEDGDILIRRADMAMYNAKKQGGNIYRQYTAFLEGENSYKMKMENELRKAIKNSEFFIYYQPKVNLETSQIIGLEALIRWQHPKWGLISPLQFISIAEETGLIVPIGQWVLQGACRQMKNWHDHGYTDLSIAVNISPRQFQDKNLIKMVKRVLQESKLDPQCLEIEVTENVMHNIKESFGILSELKELGVQISIDDFGTGYSSFFYLKHLPIDHIKIDKSFIDDSTISPRDEAIVKTMIHMGHHLQISVTAEGIENERQLQFLKGLQCNVGQGYFFSRPLPPVEVEKLFKKVQVKG
jgi:diguanylate cyclase (GGDEF)-like protein/PAS domain S-box-containing protein